MEKEILRDEAPMYLWAGRALMEAQNMETHLQNLIVVQKLINAEYDGLSCIEDLFAKYDRKTLRRLLEIARKYVKFNPTFEDKLSKALEVRNWLVHKSFGEMIEKFGGEEAKVRAPQELRSATQIMNDITVEIIEITIALATTIGVTPEMMNEELEKINAEFSVSWPSNLGLQQTVLSRHAPRKGKSRAWKNRS